VLLGYLPDNFTHQEESVEQGWVNSIWCGYFIEPYGGADCYGYYVVTNDGVLYWMMHPMAGYNPAVLNQNVSWIFIQDIYKQ
jgi:hypothetical protein